LGAPDDDSLLDPRQTLSTARQRRPQGRGRGRSLAL